MLPVDSETINQIRKLVWGEEPREDIFLRWTQGFVFSEAEPTALVQFEGGPCGILAPVQAFLLKNLLKQKKSNEWRNVTSQQSKQLLVTALCQIFEQLNVSRYTVVLGHFSCDGSPSTSSKETRDDLPSDATNVPFPKRVKLDLDHFHSSLRLVVLENSEEVQKFLLSHINLWQHTDSGGLLLFLYSVLLTKGIENVYSDMSDDETLIDSLHGHGSQSLINLMLTGTASSYVWDGVQDVGGLQLQGIQKQSEIGFLTLLEHLRYCQVGSHLKNPKQPIWLLGSETHITVLFSESKQLVSEETVSERARRIFKSFDPEGNGFISSVLLEDVLRALDLVHEKEYVQIMEQKLDPEGLGIILLSAFMEEFYPVESNSTPDFFTLWHYNGLSRSNVDSKVVYREGSATLLETQVQSISDSNSMQTCLQTKWPSIDVRWKGTATPSIN